MQLRFLFPFFGFLSCLHEASKHMSSSVAMISLLFAKMLFTVYHTFFQNNRWSPVLNGNGKPPSFLWTIMDPKSKGGGKFNHKSHRKQYSAWSDSVQLSVHLILVLSLITPGNCNVITLTQKH